MAYINETKMLQAVLMDEKLMKVGDYEASEISDIYQALNSENYVINAVAQIIHRTSEGATSQELWREVQSYLFKNV